jgi:hypothetical protein
MSRRAGALRAEDKRRPMSPDERTDKAAAVFAEQLVYCK